MNGYYHCRLTLLILAVLACGCTGPRRWERLPRPPGRADHPLCGMGLDERGELWVLSGNHVQRWDGRRFQPPDTGNDLRSGICGAGIAGSPDRGLYATQPDGIYRLRDGAVTRTAPGNKPSERRRGSTHVLRDGRLLDWDMSTLAVCDKGRWYRQQCRLPAPGCVALFEHGSNVYLYGKGRLYSVDATNGIAVTEIKAPDCAYDRAAPWGDDQAVLVKRGRAGAAVLNLATSEIVPLPGQESELRNARLMDLFATPDGSVWIIASARAAGEHALFRLAADGRLAPAGESAGAQWQGATTMGAAATVLPSGDGSLWWFEDGELARWRTGVTTRYDSRSDGSPRGTGLLLEDPRGTVYAGNRNGIYAFRHGRPVTPQPWRDFPPVKGCADSLWRHEVWRSDIPRSDWVHAAWQMPGRVVLVTRQNAFSGRFGKQGRLMVIDLCDGATRAIDLPPGTHAPLWVSPGAGSGRAILQSGGRLSVLDLAGGGILGGFDYDYDHRIAPVAVGNDLLLVKSYHGRTMARVRGDGSEVWSCRLPGYVMTHPATTGRYLLVQTRKGGGDGQATSCLDVETGTMLWTDTVNAYGFGAAFGAQASYCVEADGRVSAATTEGLLIARNPETGKKLWLYKRPGVICHRPLVAAPDDRVLAAFEDAIVCLDGRSGRLLWETSLPAPPARPPSPTDCAYLPSIGRLGDMLGVVCSDSLLYILDPVTGTVQARLNPHDNTQAGSDPRDPAQLTCMPWVTEGVLVVPTTAGVSGYSFDNAFAR